MKALLAIFGAVAALAAASGAQGEVTAERVEYRQGDAVLEGYLAYDDAVKGRRPGVLVAHEWMGLNAYAKKRADQLARLGFVAFALDVYGKGARPKDAKEAAAIAGSYKADRSLLRARAAAGLAVLRDHRMADPSRLAAIGYCFGGTTVLELARSGAELRAVVSFHGGLDAPTPRDARNIRAKILAFHGADDPFVPPAQVAAFEQEMREGGVDWQLVIYGGAVHGFTNPENGNDNAKGAAYNERADRRSWETMKAFFDETLR
jgi:dienelactone hydrolase